MKNYIQPGKVVTFTAAATVASGAGVLVGSLFGVSVGAVANGAEGEMETEGVYELPKNQADTPAQFADAYWDDTNKRVTTTDTGNTKIGVFMKADATGLATAEVRLNGVSI
ncbi:DUF2190 family protein [Pseudomaricurvus alkylphenolicus]|uniref:DUF2190 family protein n=1 Tax=Pseudomaricurvus alkylphenolicus TaxID=1306991 RepID=UPI00141FFCBF|nr:DUF2190 family protein [Pseudomaricurvus alkylphenolicus]NIB44819.1 DUF2190 family protein [Pseudomaricurvus alkylphenolicus]